MAGMNARTVIENALFMFWNLARHIRLRFRNFHKLPSNQGRASARYSRAWAWSTGSRPR